MPRGIFILAATTLALGVAVLQGCAETSAPRSATIVQHSCTAGSCMTCYIYETTVHGAISAECVKD